MLLSDTKIRAAKPRPKIYRMGDGDGLCLEVRPNGAKLWRFRYRFAGRAQMLSLGKYPDVTLRRARELRAQCRQWLADGLDPAAMRRTEKDRRAGPRTFEDVGREWFEKFSPTWSENTIKARLKRLEKNLYPLLGSRPIDEITPPDVLAALRVIEARGSLDMCVRVRQYVGQIMRYGIACGYCTHDAAADLKGAIPQPEVTHYPTLTSEAEIGRLMRRIAAFTGATSTVYAMRLAPYVFLRPTELRTLTWADIAWDAAEIRIPRERMKGGRIPHIVPMARQVAAILSDLHPLTSWSPLLFPGRSMDRPISENTMRRGIHRMGYSVGELTPHGFRGMASTLLNEHKAAHPWDEDVIERQLAHVEENKVRDAYNHARYLPLRRDMMQWYADYLDTLRDSGDG